jgi:hypothetical protein
MPQVPVYGERQVRSQALEPVFQQTPDVSSGLNAVAKGLGVAAEVADRIDLRDQHAAASNVERQITAEWLKWDASPEGRAKYRGENADGYTAAAEAWWEKAREAYGKDLNPRAAAIASPGLANKRLSAMANVQQFQAGEKERHADQVYEADVATTIQFGVTSGDVESTARQIREKAAVLGARKGYSTEQVQAEVNKNLSAMHIAQISKLVEQPGGATVAQMYYEANKGEINFAQQNNVEKILKAEVDNQFATQFAAKVATQPLADQIKAAGEIKDPAQREKSITQIKLNHALVAEARRETEQKFSDQAWQLVGQGKRVPEAILAGMDGRDRVQLQEHLRTKAERLAAGKPVKTDWATYITLREKLAAGEKIDLRAYTEKIGPGQLEQLLDIQTKVTKPGKVPEVATAEQQIATYTNSLKLGGEKNATKRGQFVGAAQDMFNEHLKRSGKDPDFDERQKILDKLTTYVVTKKGWIWDDTAPVYTLPRDQVRDQVLGAPAPANNDKFVTGQTYTDAKGNKARYLGNGKWETLK